MELSNAFDLDLPASAYADQRLQRTDWRGAHPAEEAWHAGSPALAPWFASQPVSVAEQFARRAGRADTLSTVLEKDVRKTVHAAVLCNPNTVWGAREVTALQAVRDGMLLEALGSRNGPSMVYLAQLNPEVGKKHPLALRLREIVKEGPFKTRLALQRLLSDSKQWDVLELHLPEPDYRPLVSRRGYRELKRPADVSPFDYGHTSVRPQPRNRVPMQRRAVPQHEVDDLTRWSRRSMSTREVFMVTLGLQASKSREWVRSASRDLLSQHITWETISGFSRRGVTIQHLREYGRSGERVMTRRAFEKLKGSAPALELFADLMADWDGTFFQLIRTVKAAAS